MPKTPTISFVSLGCSKNLVDSERMLGLLAQGGYAIVPESQPADLVVINTCGFIETARQESIGVIEEMLERKRLGHVKGVIVAGCLAERAERHARSTSFPRSTRSSACSAARRSFASPTACWAGLHEQRGLFRPAPVQAQDDRARLRITPRHLAYLKVSEGCDRYCTFCAIPFMRGKHVTKPIEMVVAEAARARSRRRPRADPGRTGHDILRRRPLRPASPRRTAHGARARSRGSTGSASSTAIPSSSPTSFTTSWAARERSSPIWTCRFSTSTTACSS